MRKEPSLKNVFFALFFLVLTTLWADLQYAVFLGLFTLMLLVHDLLFKTKQIGKFMLRLGIMSAIFFGLMALIIGPLLFGILTGKYAYATPLPQDSLNYSADLLGFFTPSNLNLSFGKYTQEFSSHFSTSWIETVYIGYTVLALALFATIKSFKASKTWLFGAFVFVILSLGPILHVYGISSFTSQQINIPLPEGLLLSIIPIFRAPSRFILMAMLCLAVLSAISLKHVNVWFAKLKRGKIVSLLFLVFLSVAFLAETNTLPFSVVDTSVPAFYADISKMNGTFSVLDLPQDYYDNNRYMYYGTVSEKPLVGGSVSRIAPDNFQFLQVFPLISQMDYVVNYGEATNWRDIFLQDVNMTNLVSLHLFNVSYVILHKDFWNDVAVEKMDAYLNGLLGQPVFSDDRIVAFSTNSTQLYPNSIFAFCSNGWCGLEEWSGIPTRWMDGNGTVEVMSPSSTNYNLSFNAVTKAENKSLKVFLNGEEVGDFQISVDVFSLITLNGLHFKVGHNKLLFCSEKSFVPVEVFTDDSDARRLSIAFQNVSILPQIK